MQVLLKSMQKEQNEWEKQVRHQIEIEHDSNKSRFSASFVDAIMEIIKNARDEAKEEARNELVKEFIETGGISFTASMTTEYNKIKGSKGTS